MKGVIRAAVAASIAVACSAILVAQEPATPTQLHHADASPDELFARAAGSRAMLRLLLQTFPKGGDLHRHAGGTTYAEDFLAWAEDDGGCFVLATNALAAGPCEVGESEPLEGLALRDLALYNRAINSISMGRHGPQYKHPTISGHEQFFSSSPRRNFSESRHRNEVIADNLAIAAGENTLYLELASNPDMSGADLASLVPQEPWNEADLAGRLQRLQPYLEQAVTLARKNTDASERRVAELNRCDARPKPAACDVTLRYLITVSRRAAIEEQFTTMALAFALVDADPRWVGINIAAPEDLPAALRDYSLHMRMFAFFKQRYPEVPLTLHSGELWLGLVPPRDLTFHIREAVEVAGASRIGHGVDIAYEHGAAELLARMARDGVAVEINLTSNDVILGVKGKDHPLPLYMAAGVPVTLSSDDLGVSRADLTQEYVRAVDEHGLTYSQLKEISRNTIAYSFLAPLDKARELRRLERAFAEYEARLPEIFRVVSAAAADTDAQLDALFARGAGSGAMLRLLLQSFPKGADLHRHSEGATYAEEMIEWAAAKNGCLVGAPPGDYSLQECTDPAQPRLRGLRERDAAMYNDAIDSLSMGRHVPLAGDPTVSGHERFFRSFGRFSFAVQGERARVLADNRAAAALDRIHYLELGSGPRLPPELRSLVPEEPWNEKDWAGRFKRLEPYLAAAVAAARSTTDEDERRVAELNGCHAEPAPPACDVTLRYLTTVGRGNADRAQVFASMALAFALVDADPRFVGVNIAAPEDSYVALRDYRLHMRMFAFFKKQYPQVPLTLHAGELALGLVPPSELTYHIRDAVEVAGARRIGHGVDIAYESGAVQLLQRMAREGIAVEINLTSNDVILGVKGKDHPLPIYLGAGVPVALSSDDPGVSRADLTQEYMRAVSEHGLSYTQLRQLSRNSLTYSFIEGESLWRADGRTKVKVCDVSLDRPTAACEAYLAANAKAREQWRLERAFAAYEAELPKLLAALPVAARRMTSAASTF